MIEDLTQMKPVEQKKQRSLGNNSKDWRPQLKPVPNTVSNMDKVSQFEPKNKKPPIYCTIWSNFWGQFHL